MIAGEKVGRSASTKLVLVRLADRADPVGKCWPGHETTAVDLDLSPSTVVTAVRDLETRGLLRVEHQRDAAGRDLHNVYHLQIQVAAPPYPTDKRKALQRRRRGKRGGDAVPECGTAPPDSRAGVSEIGPEPKTSKPNKEQQHVRAYTYSPRPSPDTAAADKEKPRATVGDAETPEGVHFWPDDIRTARLDRLYRDFPSGEIVEGARACKAAGEDPLPNRVRKRVEGAKQKVKAAEAALIAREAERRTIQRRADEQREREARRNDPNAQAAAQAALRAIVVRLS